MLFLLLQTFAWMLLAGLVGAVIGCLARRIFAPVVADDERLSAPAVAATAATAAAVATKGPVIEASKAPAAVAAKPMPVAATPVAPTPAAAPKPYDYPITTVGIPRGTPELIQPQIKKIDLAAPAPPAPAPVTPQVAAGPTAATSAAAVSTATVKIVTPPAAPPVAPVAAAPGSYPITTIGIPPAVPAPVPPSTPTAAALAAVKGDASRFAKALAGQPVVATQPRPEPLRPELARPPVVAAAPVAPVAPAAPKAPPAPAPTPPAPAAMAPPAPAPAPPAPAVQPPAPVPPVPVAKAPAPIAPAAQSQAAATATAAAATVAAAVTAAASAAAAKAPAPAAPVPAPAPAAVAPVAAAPVAAGPAAASDDFTRIRAIDPDLQRRLNALGVTRFTDIAKLSPADVARLSQTLGLLGRVEQENWIEQAQILASGGDTYYSRRRQRGEIAAPEPVWAAPSAGASAANAATAAAAAAAAATAAATAATVAAANAAEPVKPARLIDAIKSNQAGDDAGRPRSDLSGLRSVRSEALRPDASAAEGLRSTGGSRPLSQIDDLKRVRGVGVLIEKKLNSLGITTYEQIANWTNADIDRVSQILDFKGRIERESWVEQARILASGGHTEFSRRVDRGEA
jgi:predicted flap endonuclease-1-like 5' DNA nuclease